MLDWRHIKIILFVSPFIMEQHFTNAVEILPHLESEGLIKS